MIELDIGAIALNCGIGPSLHGNGVGGLGRVAANTRAEKNIRLSKLSKRSIRVTKHEPFAWLKVIYGTIVCVLCVIVRCTLAIIYRRDVVSY
jgi:hypothetical protein